MLGSPDGQEIALGSVNQPVVVKLELKKMQEKYQKKLRKKAEKFDKSQEATRDELHTPEIKESEVDGGKQASLDESCVLRR